MTAPSTPPSTSLVRLGETMFRLRDYTPIPLIVLLLVVREPTVPMATCGTLLIVLGELFRIYAVSFIGGVSRTRSDSVGGKVVDSGPFAFVRNPLYIGNFAITVGISLFSGKLWFVVITTLLFIFQYYCIVSYEEELLESRFGNDYLEYRQRVPAWFPRRFPTLDGLEWPISFSPALRSEKRTLTAIVAILILLMVL